MKLNARSHCQLAIPPMSELEENGTDVPEAQVLTISANLSQVVTRCVSRELQCQERASDCHTTVPQTLIEAGVNPIKESQENEWVLDLECKSGKVGIHVPQSEVGPIHSTRVCTGQLINGRILGLHEFLRA